ncbi:hypothetical protein PILCRDRAFT_97738 [Piloderma croceum F 1598]|uniref:Uncharacterized protein n=1 Tax=Piloderma croceum (strain F 1598) TaxID=765440 RepID=A0A0C3B469_PILCF|nr:hypothetical protein PILCRDRAFT_97738 [Piloderma croceum F 1598]
MIIPGQAVLSRQIRVLRSKSAGVVDFDNAHRKTSATAEIPFQKLHIANGHSSSQNQSEDSIHLAPGAYLVEFNETVDTPLDAMGQLFVRSSLFRSGALVSAGVMDAGYKGAIGGMLQVVNPFGLTVYKNAKLGQFVFHELKDKVRIYVGLVPHRINWPPY